MTMNPEFSCAEDIPDGLLALVHQFMKAEPVAQFNVLVDLLAHLEPGVQAAVQERLQDTLELEAELAEEA